MNNIRKKFSLKYIVPLYAAAMSVSCSPGGGYISVTGYAQGGTYTVKLNMDTDKGRVRMSPDEIRSGIDSVILAIDNSLSGYNKGSLLSRFNAGETIVPDDIFIDIYKVSYDFYRKTDGAFDVAAGPLFDIWGFGFKGNGFPDDSQVNEILAGCGMGRLVENIESAVASDGTLAPYDLLRSELREASDNPALPVLNYNAIAQGYTCDLIAGYLYSLGVKDMLVDIGGEIYCDGVNPGGTSWKIGVDKPVDGNDTPGAQLEGIVESGGGRRGIVTSGNYRKFYIKDGKKYAHTIDSRTGYPVSHTLLSATVLAGDATAADALATYCMVIGLEQAMEFLETGKSLSGEYIEGLDGYLIYDDNGSMKTWSSAALR